MIEPTHFGPCGVLDAEELALVAMSVSRSSPYRHTFGTRQGHTFSAEWEFECPCGATHEIATRNASGDAVIECPSCGDWHSVQWRAA